MFWWHWRVLPPRLELLLEPQITSVESVKILKKPNLITAAIASIIGVLVGSYQVGFIIILAVPALMFLYPITIVLIVLNVLPDKLASKKVFRGVVLVTFLSQHPRFFRLRNSERIFSGSKKSHSIGKRQFRMGASGFFSFYGVEYYCFQNQDFQLKAG